MHRLTIYTCAALAVFATAIAVLWPVSAAQPPASQRIDAEQAELLVFEANNCLYCFVFRRDVVPNYLRSPRARRVPLRFIDVHETDLSQIKLAAPVTVLPTVVLMKKGRETNRINGYMGPEPFFHMVARMMRGR